MYSRKMSRSHVQARMPMIAAMVIALAFAGWSAQAQFTAGSDGSDGVFAPVADQVIDMTLREDGIYHYVSVNIPAGVTITFAPNAANTPVTWLVQTTVVIDGTVSLDGEPGVGTLPGAGGPGGFGGGIAPLATPGGADPGSGDGPGGGNVSAGTDSHGGSAGFGEAGDDVSGFHPPGQAYGNKFLLPLVGGSGGSGGTSSSGFNGGAGGGGGGAVLIAADQSITINGALRADGGNGAQANKSGGAGSGGAIRLVAPTLSGTGTVSVDNADIPNARANASGRGRIRLDGTVIDFTQGTLLGINSQGSPTILMLPDNIRPRLDITSVGGISIVAPTSSDPAIPDVTFPSTAPSQVDVVVDAANVPAGTTIDLNIRPKFGAAGVFSGTNAGTLAASTATITVDLPPGDGSLFASAVVTTAEPAKVSMRKSGLAANGERFVGVEMKTELGGQTRLAYVTASGERFLFPPSE